MAGAEFIRDNKDEEEMEIESTDNERTGDYDHQQNCQEVLNEDDLEEAEALSTPGVKATSYGRYPTGTWYSWFP